MKNKHGGRALARFSKVLRDEITGKLWENHPLSEMEPISRFTTSNAARISAEFRRFDAAFLLDASIRQFVDKSNLLEYTVVIE